MALWHAVACGRPPLKVEGLELGHTLAPDLRGGGYIHGVPLHLRLIIEEGQELLVFADLLIITWEYTSILLVVRDLLLDEEDTLSVIFESRVELEEGL